MKITLNKIEEYKKKRKKWDNEIIKHEKFSTFFTKMLAEPVLEKREAVFKDFEKYYNETKPNPERLDGPGEIKMRIFMFLCFPYRLFVSYKDGYGNDNMKFVLYKGCFDITPERVLEETKDIPNVKKIRVSGSISTASSETILEIEFE